MSKTELYTFGLTRGETFKDARIVHNINGKQKIRDVSSRTGISASMVSDLENDEKNRGASYETVAILASHYGVSCDYLCGLSEFPRSNPNTRAIKDYTGLSETSVDLLHRINENQDELAKYSALTSSATTKMINFILEDTASRLSDETAYPFIETILTDMYRYLNADTAHINTDPVMVPPDRSKYTKEEIREVVEMIGIDKKGALINLGDVYEKMPIRLYIQAMLMENIRQSLMKLYKSYKSGKEAKNG